MFYRVILNRHPVAALLFAVVLLAVSAAWMGYTIATRPKKTSVGPLQRFYYDVSTGELFTADAGLKPPIQRFLPDSPPTGVVAHVFACGSCEDEAARFIGYIETYKPDEAVRAITSAGAGSRTLGVGPRRYPRPSTHDQPSTQPAHINEPGRAAPLSGEGAALRERRRNLRNSADLPAIFRPDATRVRRAARSEDESSTHHGVASSQPMESSMTAPASPDTQAGTGDAGVLPTTQRASAGDGDPSAVPSDAETAAALEAARRIASPSQLPVWLKPDSPEGVALRAKVDTRCGAAVVPKRCMPGQ